jgi:hypothetical protein
VPLPKAIDALHGRCEWLRRNLRSGDVLDGSRAVLPPPTDDDDTPI